MRPRRIGRSGCVDNRQVLLVEQRLQRRQRRMQSEKTVEVNRRIRPLVAAAGRPGNRNRRPQTVVRPLAMRHYDIQPIGGAALENGH